MHNINLIKHKNMKLPKNSSIKMLLATIAMYASLVAADGNKNVVNDSEERKIIANNSNLKDDDSDSAVKSKNLANDLLATAATVEEKPAAVAAGNTVASEEKPTFGGVVVGWGVAFAQSVSSALNYMTPTFVTSAYNNVRDFFGNIADFFSRISTKK